MRINVDTNPGAKSPEDEGLRCPKCEYNLTGLTDDVCPECGVAFDRRQLVAEIRGTSQLIPNWSERHTNGWVRSFVLTLIDIWIHPIRFARRFPGNPRVSDARAFSRTCLMVSVMLWIIAERPTHIYSYRGALLLILTLVELVALVFACEFLCNKLIFASLDTIGRHEIEWKRHRSLIRMTRGFMVLTALSILLTDWLHSRSFRWYGLDIRSRALWPTLAVIAYWWLCLALMAFALSKKRSTFIRALIALPVIFLLLFGISYTVEPMRSFFYLRLARS